MREINKKYILRFRSVDKENFDEIKKRLKTIETRAATERYRKIKKGDTLVIVCGKNHLSKKVKQVKIFKSINAMVKEVPIHKIMPSLNTISEIRKVYYSYPAYKTKIRKHGIIAFYL